MTDVVQQCYNLNGRFLSPTRTYEVDLHRWILRAIIRGVPTAHFMPIVSPPALDKEKEGEVKELNSENKEDVKLKEKEDKDKDQQSQQPVKPSFGDPSLPSRNFLKQWIMQNMEDRNEKQPSDDELSRKEKDRADTYFLVVAFELGEFHFFIEDFAEAEKLFLVTKERVNQWTTRNPLTEKK